MIEKLVKTLKNDKELFYAYQANIAMQFKDEYARNKKPYKNKKDIHVIASNAAKEFLDLFIKDA